MIEVSELITSGRTIVLVLQDVPTDAIINGHVSNFVGIALTRFDVTNRTVSCRHFLRTR